MVAVVSLWATAAGAQPEVDPLAPAADTDRWVPSFAVISGLRFLGADAKASSSIRDPARGDDYAVDPQLGFNLQIMTPSILDEGPRFFFHGGVLPDFGFDRDIAKEGDPDGFKLPPQPQFPEAAIGGVGTAVSMNPDHISYILGAGVAFEMPFMDRTLRIKPSLEYIHYELEIEGVMLDAEKASVADPNIRFVSIRGSENLPVDGIGPGLELELDAGKWRDFGISIFTGAQAYAVLGDTEVNFGGEFADGEGPESANFSLEIDPWLFRIHMGLRIHWLPE